MLGDRFNWRDATPGTWMSGVGHIVLIIWILTGIGMDSEPLDFEITPVQTVSGEEYAAMVAAAAERAANATNPTPTAEVETAPEVVETPPPPAEPEVVDTPPPPAEAPAPPPVPEQPPAEVTPPPQDAPPPPSQNAPPPPPAEMTSPDPVVLPNAPQSAARPQPRPAPRVAAEAVAPPPPDVTTAPVVQENVQPAEEAPAEPQEVEELPATAPEETATEIVTEAAQPSGAPESATRPQTRPQRRQPAPEPERPAETPAETPRPTETPAERPAETPAERPAQTPAVDTTADDIAAAVAAAAAAAVGEAATAPAASQGAPMTGAERDAFRLAVSGCWAVDTGSEAAMVQLTVAFELDRAGRVVGNEVRRVSASGGSDAAVQVAFDTARRAILRCQGQNGYQLPADKFDQWQMVEMTFDPSGMRLR